MTVPEGVNVPVDPIVRVPFTVNAPEAVTAADAFNVRSLNVNVPELAIDDPLFIVIVPPLGVNVPVTVNAPPTVAVPPAPVIDPLTFKPPYVRFERTSPAPA